MGNTIMTHSNALMLEGRKNKNLEDENKLLRKRIKKLEDKLEIKDLIILSNGSENILVEKSNLINSGQLLNNIEEDNIVNMDLHRDPLTDIDTLRFSPIVIPMQVRMLTMSLKFSKQNLILVLLELDLLQ